MMGGNPSAITTALAVDPAFVQSAAYRFNANDRQYQDNQIRGVQQHLVDALIKNRHATYVRVASTSAALAVGDVVCLSSLNEGEATITKCTLDALSNAHAAFGVVLLPASPGAMALVALAGVLPRSITNLAPEADGFVRINTTTARCERVTSFSPGDYGIGVVDIAGFMQVVPGLIAGDASGAADEGAFVTIDEDPTEDIDAHFGADKTRTIAAVAAGTITLPGILPPDAGRSGHITIVNDNADSATLVIQHDNGFAPESGFALPDAVDLTIMSGESRQFFYDHESTRWRILYAESGTAPFTLAGVCTLEQFGALGDGSTDDGAAIEAAEAALLAGTYHTLLVGAKTYKRTSGSLTVPAGCSVVGWGLEESKLTTTANAPVVIVGGSDVTLQGFSVVGNSTGASQHGIYNGDATTPAFGKAHLSIRNVRAVDLGGIGFLLDGSGDPTLDRTSVIGSYAVTCGVAGFKFDSRLDGISLEGCMASDSAIGVWINAAQAITWSGGRIYANTKNVKADGAFSNLRNAFIGTSIYGTTTRGLDITSGYGGLTFSACNINTSPCYIVAAANIKFVGCSVGIGTYDFGAGSGSSVDFIDCIVSASATYTDVTGNVVRWLNCRDRDGAIGSFISDRMQPTFTFPGDSFYDYEFRYSQGDELTLAQGSLLSNGQYLRVRRNPDIGTKLLVKNSTAFDIEIRWESGTGVTVSAGRNALIGADGTDAVLLLPSEPSGYLGDQYELTGAEPGGAVPIYDRITSFTSNLSGIAYAIGGIVPPGVPTGKTYRLLVHNTDTTAILTLSNEDTAAVAANRITTRTGVDLLLAPGDCCELYYNGALIRWIVLWNS